MMRTIITPPTCPIGPERSSIGCSRASSPSSPVGGGGAHRAPGMLSTSGFCSPLPFALPAKATRVISPEARVLRDYLDEKISLGKAAELLQLTRFELEGSFQRLGISIRRGARSIEDAQAEIAAARLNRDRPTSDAASALELAEFRLHRLPDRNPGLTQGHANSGVAGRHEAGARQPGYAAYIS